MAAKISTLILKVDLNCYKCYNKIRKVLCRFHSEIQSQAFDEKNNTVTISGPFDPEKLSKKLCCKAGKTIIDIQIKKEPEKPKPKPSNPEPTKPNPPAPIPQPVQKPPEPVQKPPAAVQKPPEPVQKAPEPVPKIGIPYQYPPVIGVCCWPYYEGHHYGGPGYDQGYGGRDVTPSYEVHGRPQCYCGCGGYRSCDYFSEEDPTSCTIM